MTAADNIVKSVGSLFGTNKFKTLEYTEVLYLEVHERKFKFEKAGE